MEQRLNPRAKLTHKMRAAIQKSKKTLEEIAREYGVNIGTAHKWRSRKTVEDIKRVRRRRVTSAVPSPAKEEFLLKFRAISRLSVLDIYAVLKDGMPNLMLSDLRSCLQRHGVSKRIEAEDGYKRKKKRYEIGQLHIYIEEVWHAEGKGYIFIAIDHKAKLAFAKVYKNKTEESACDFLRHILKIIPYIVSVILIGSGAEFIDIIQNRKHKIKTHTFAVLCQHYNIEHKLVKVEESSPNSKTGKINSVIKEANTQYQYGTLSQLQAHLDTFLFAFNTTNLKALLGKSPWDFLLDRFKAFRYNFKDDPFHYFPIQYTSHLKETLQDAQNITDHFSVLRPSVVSSKLKSHI